MSKKMPGLVGADVRAAAAELGDTVGDIEHEEEDGGQGESSASPPSAKARLTEREAGLRQYQMRLVRALQRETRSGAALQAMAARMWTAEAKNKPDPSEFLSPFLSRYPQSAMPLSLKLASLDKTESLGTKWRCAQFRRRVVDIDDFYNVTTEWNAAFHHPAHPEVVLAMKFRSSQASPTSTAKMLSLDVAFSVKSDADADEDLLLLPAEVSPLSMHCRRCLQPCDALIASERYLEKSRQRMECLERLAERVSIEEGERGIKVCFVNDHGVQLCSADWDLTFREDELDFAQEYLVKFNEEGRKSAQECSFPERLLTSGSCPEWSAEYCVRNLERMTSLDETGA